jgi:extracellular factor (EF) 3-hydroxypalmitic acid methyl ester biosynthesis protein
MLSESAKIKAQLVAGDKKIPIDAKYTSKYSLLVKFLNGDGFKDGSMFSKLLLDTQGGNVELGPCKLLSEPNIDGYAGRLVFTSDVYDLKSLIFGKKIVPLNSAFFNLPLVLAHKESISRDFKDFTADLNYDLSVYRNTFDRLDAEYSGEPANIKEMVQEAIIETQRDNLLSFLNDRQVELERIVSHFKEEEHKYHGFYFRRQLWDIIIAAPFMARTNLKPRGYSGDSEMMRMVYSNDYRGRSTFAKLMHKYPLEQPGAYAVRSRRKLTAKTLRKMAEAHQLGPQEKLRVLSVACGPAIEMQDILQTEADCEKYHFTLLDQDRLALLEAAAFINEIEKSLDAKVTVDYLNKSVRTMLTTRQLKAEWGQFDLIYSMGLFDYLTPPVARAVIAKLYQLLKPEGQMLLGNFHTSSPSRCYMEYWLDWVLYYRSEDEFANLLVNEPSAENKVFFEDTGVQMFLNVRKRK